jgi:DNA-directed RNA polymerase subunit RPC12/RpoP
MDYTGTVYVCDECSQMYRIHIECETTTLPIAHCPVCGTPTLRHVRSVLDSSLTGTHLSTYALPLRTLMYQMWKAHLLDTTRTLPIYTRYVDYVAALVASGGDAI